VKSYIEDLTPFFGDRCWMFVLLARRASVGVILRRGPTAWWRVTRWDTGRDRFEAGQWFRGRIYPDKCDVSPDGKFLVYFAAKFYPHADPKGIGSTWTAVSRPPYLTALALWPGIGTWGGSGVFLDDRTVLVATGWEHHPNHPPGPLRVLEYNSLKRGDPRHDVVPCWQNGWQGILAPHQPDRYSLRYTAWRKTSGSLTLERGTDCERVWGEMNYDQYPSRRRSLYTLYRTGDEPVALFEAHWADWDQQGRLVATVGGRVFEGKLTKGFRLRWRQLAAMNEEQPSRMEAPSWAQRW
jgi:hypothetical protein